MPGVDVEEHRSGSDPPPDAAWSAAAVLKRRGGGHDRTSIIVALAVAAVALAVVKPWALGSPSASGTAAVASDAIAAPSPPAIALPTPGPAVVDPNAMICLTHQVEQVLTLERWPDREVKSWAQPDGGAILVSSTHVVGIGVCPGIAPPPTGPAGAGASRNPLVWSAAVVTDVRLLDGTNRDLGAPPRITTQTDYVAAGVLYGPPVMTVGQVPGSSPPALASPSTGVLSSWRAGRYELTYVFPGDPEQTVRTVVVKITTPFGEG